MLRWRRRASSARPCVPPGQRVYAIGDIHGRSDLLDRLIGFIHRDLSSYSGDVTLIFIGDYVDRGPDSRGVVDILLDIKTRFQSHFLRGNHDQAMLDFLADPQSYPAWRSLGAADTVLSYGARPPDSLDRASLYEARDRLAQAIPPAHLQLFQSLENSFQIGDYYFSHAGVRPGVPLEEQDPQDLIWIRDEFLNSKRNFGKVVVHGHSPMTNPVRKANRISIDTGAYQSGKLTAAVMEGSKIRFLQS